MQYFIKFKIVEQNLESLMCRVPIPCPWNSDQQDRGSSEIMDRRQRGPCGEDRRVLVVQSLKEERITQMTTRKNLRSEHHRSVIDCFLITQPHIGNIVLP